MDIGCPKITVITPTFNRPDCLKDTISSVVNQAMQNWEMLVVNDGGKDVRQIVDGFDDNRITYFNRRKNRGKAACLNFALEMAKGDYIAYIDDDDIWYPNHLQVLAGALDKNPDTGVVYSDLYAVQFIKDETTGKRYPLHKFIQACRDFNRDFMFWYNHTLHVSLMHRKELAFKAGGYDEDITVLIDWNITRKFCFFTDFKHIPQLTGEYYMPVGKSDRISNLEREDEEKFKHNMRKIKADLPPEPWSKVDKIAVIFPVNEWADPEVKIITGLCDKLCYPVRFVLVNNDVSKDESDCKKALGKIGELKNISIYTPKKKLSELESYRFGAQGVDADYLYLPSKNVDTTLELRLIKAIHYIKDKEYKAIKWDVEQEKKYPFDILIDKIFFIETTDPVKEQKEIVAQIMPLHSPQSFESDFYLQQAAKQHGNGNYETAYQFIKKAYDVKKGGAGSQFVINLYSKICFDYKKYDEAEEKCKTLIEKGYGADNWIRMGKLMQRRKKYDQAINAFKNGLKEIGLKDADLSSKVFPISAPLDFGSFEALIGMAECLIETDRLTEASKNLHKAAKIKADSHRPFSGFARLFLKTGEFERARQAIDGAVARDGKNPEVFRLYGDLFKNLEKFDIAYDFYIKAFNLDKRDEQNIETVFKTGSRLNKWKEMKDIFLEFLEHRPGNMAALTGLSMVYYQLGEYERSREFVEKGLLFDRNNLELKGIYEKIQLKNG